MSSGHRHAILDDYMCCQGSGMCDEDFGNFPLASNNDNNAEPPFLPRCGGCNNSCTGRFDGDDVSPRNGQSCCSPHQRQPLRRPQTKRLPGRRRGHPNYGSVWRLLYTGMYWYDLPHRRATRLPSDSHVCPARHFWN